MGWHCRSWGGTPVLEPCWSCWRHHGDTGPWVITASQRAHPAGPFRQAEVTTAGRRFHRRGSADTCWRNIAKSLGCSRKRRGDLLPVRRPSASCLSPALLEEGWLGGGGGKESQGAPRTPWVSNVGGGCAGTPTARPGKPGLPGDSHVPPPSPTRQMSPGPWSSTSLLPAWDLLVPCNPRPLPSQRLPRKPSRPQQPLVGLQVSVGPALRILRAGIMASPAALAQLGSAVLGRQRPHMGICAPS